MTALLSRRSDQEADARAAALLLCAAGQLPIEAVEVLTREDGLQFVQVHGVLPAADATRLLVICGATRDVGVADEPTGPEMSGRTEAGTWVYIPCDPEAVTR